MLPGRSWPGNMCAVGKRAETDEVLIDDGAVQALRQDRVDWRFKGLPVSVEGRTVGAVADAHLNVFEDGFLGPVLTIDEVALENNIATMASWCVEHGLELAPHAKTTMAPQIWARQLHAGAWGLTAANVAQLRVYRAFGVSRVIFANQLVDVPGIRWVDQERIKDPSFTFVSFADTLEVVAAMSAAIATAGARPVDVVVEVGRNGGRSGARTHAAALEVAKAVAACPELRLVGVGGYEGVLVNDPSPHSVSVIDGFLKRMRAVTVDIYQRGLFESDEVLVTAGGSCFFDRVAALLGGKWPSGMEVRTVLRSGCYVTHDDGFYRWMSPFPRGTAGRGSLLPALKLWARVTSMPEPGLALVTAGKRDLSFDAWPPEPQAVRDRNGQVRPLLDCVVKQVNDQHAFVELPQGNVASIGDWLCFGLSYPCTAFDKWQLIPVLRGETVVDLVRTYF